MNELITIEKAGKYPKHSIILAGKLGDLKRTKKLLEWEHKLLKDGTLKYCFAMPRDIVIIQSENGQSFRIIASKIPDHYVNTQILNLIDNHINKVCRPKIKIKKIYVKGKEKSKINYEGDIYGTVKVSS